MSVGAIILTVALSLFFVYQFTSLILTIIKHKRKKQEYIERSKRLDINKEKEGGVNAHLE